MVNKGKFSIRTRNQFLRAFLFSALLLAACISISRYLPSDPNASLISSATKTTNTVTSNADSTDQNADTLTSDINNVASNKDSLNQEDSAELPEIIEDDNQLASAPTFDFKLIPASFGNTIIDYTNQEDKGLTLYRNEKTKAAVEWFYTNVTDNRDITLAILEYAELNNIPLSLAFALAWTESRYNPKAFNSNSNTSIDRGLFQLNSRSFPKLTEDDFYDVRISAKYGMSHLRFCLDTAGNEISALAMYNAGTNKVRSNNTPQQTLNYVSKIINYQQGIEELFDIEVVAFYCETESSYLAMAKK